MTSHITIELQAINQNLAKGKETRRLESRSNILDPRKRKKENSQGCEPRLTKYYSKILFSLPKKYYNEISKCILIPSCAPCINA